MKKVKASIILLIALGVLTLHSFSNEASSPAAPAATNGDVIFLDQGWSAGERQAYYHADQGTRLMPYNWFLALEQPGLSGKPFLSDEILEQFNLLPDPDTTNNPDRLPVGLVKNVAPDGEFVGLTCAACHTSQIQFNGKKVRIEGGAAMSSPNTFSAAMFKALLETKVNPIKFRRFAKKVLGERDDLGERLKLKVEMTKVLEAVFGDALLGKLKHLYPVEEGFGRLDALGRGGNLIFGTELDSRNFVVADGPVSLPHLWDAPSFDWVQWNGSIQQPMARNIAEALGVNAPITLKGNSQDLFNTTVPVVNLHKIEMLLEKLRPPKWPAEILGGIDEEKARRGEALYARHCAGCHESQLGPPNEFGKRFLHIQMFPLDVIGTDPTTAVNFNKRTVRTTGLPLPNPMSAAGALEAVANQVEKKKYDELGLTPEQRIEMNGFRANKLRPTLSYRARNMNGIWASAPYLHNGSVPNLYELLLPASQRSRTFYVKDMEFDTKRVGYKTGKVKNAFKFDTSKKGNSNAGHEYRDGPRTKGVIGPALTDEERWALVEYLKTR
ncbi:MAG TPA: cytochrome c [Blastocatellia bacterium]|nr:cytochrome c [Blastocatellia bacterium]